MVKIIHWKTYCKNCEVRLEYYNEDIQTEVSKYIHYYIVCPNCGKKVYISHVL